MRCRLSRILVGSVSAPGSGRDGFSPCQTGHRKWYFGKGRLVLDQSLIDSPQKPSSCTSLPLGILSAREMRQPDPALERGQLSSQVFPTIPAFRPPRPPLFRSTRETNIQFGPVSRLHEVRTAVVRAL